MQCTTCGYENGIDVRACTLCGTRLDVRFDQPHRVPTGVGISRPLAGVAATGEGHSTDQGSGGYGAVDSRPATEPDVPPFPRVPSGRKAPSGPVEPVGDEPDEGEPPSTPRRGGRSSDLGELAGQAAALASGMAGERLVGHVKLVVEQGRIIGEQYLLSEADMLIGRADPDSRTFPDIDLGGQDNDYVHRAHARITFHDLATRLSVEHLGGANPTLVNNHPVEQGEMVELHVGDRLRVGRVVMRLLRV